MADQRRHPGDTLLSALIAAEDESGRLSEDGLLATVVLLFFAGHDTTMNLIGNGVLALLNAPEQWRLLVEDPTLSRRAELHHLAFAVGPHYCPGAALARLRLTPVDAPAGGEEHSRWPNRSCRPVHR